MKPYRQDIIVEDNNSGPTEGFFPIIEKIILAIESIMSQSRSKRLFMYGPYNG